MVSKNIYENKGNLKWCIREKSVKDIDDGWRFISDIDTDEFLSNNDNWCILAYETVVELEPAIMAIYSMPIGTELTLIDKNDVKCFVDTNSGNPIKLEYSN